MSRGAVRNEGDILNKDDEQLKQVLVKIIKMTNEELDRVIDFMKKEDSITQSTKSILTKMITVMKEVRKG